jgi:hypothetical protein
VKDIRASKAFYEQLGFSEFGGNIDQNWLILKNGATLIGLVKDFRGMLIRETEDKYPPLLGSFHLMLCRLGAKQNFCSCQ